MFQIFLQPADLLEQAAAANRVELVAQREKRELDPVDDTQGGWISLPPCAAPGRHRCHPIAHGLSHPGGLPGRIQRIVKIVEIVAPESAEMRHAPVDVASKAVLLIEEGEGVAAEARTCAPGDPV